MSQAWSSAAVIWSGTAVALRHPGASPSGNRTITYHQIMQTQGLPPWQPGDSLPTIKSAELTGEGLAITMAESELTIPLPSAPLRVLHNATLLPCTDPSLAMIPKGAIVLQGPRIAWLGSEADLSDCSLDLSQATRQDLEGRLVSPGLVDCHAHPLFAGNRASEFAMRAGGAHYLDIAKAGGGINATVTPTREASILEHVSLCAQRMQHALSQGTTTMEAKSGYDLSVEGELRLLQVAQMVSGLQPTLLMPTLLGAHALPAEFKNDRAGFLRSVEEEMIPRAAREGLATAVDVYCDDGAFTLEETRSILERAQREGLQVKAHIGQFADLGGAQLLAELGALSGDHLEQVSQEGMQAMAKAGVVATMLPGACVQLKMDPPPVAALRDAGVTLALGSDLNPGTSHSESLPLAMWLATTHLSMTVEEAWLGVTKHGAQALGQSDIGELAAGKAADLVIWEVDNYAEVPYHFGVNLVSQTIKAGL